jgi:S1-C subfamily serine protease
VDKINHDGISATTRLLFSLVVEAANQPSRLPFRGESRFEGPADLAKLDKPISPRVPRLGIAWQDKDGDPPGVTLTNVTPGSAADRAGLRIGDRLIRFAGQEPSNASRLGVAIWAARSPATAVIEREGGPTLQILVELDGRPLRYGISWREDKCEPGTVLLTEVVPQSAANLAGLQVGDRIYRVADSTFRDADELARRLATLPSPVPVQIERQGQLRTISIDAPSGE